MKENTEKQMSIEIFNKLSKGKFLSYNTDDERENILYKSLDENKEYYTNLFSRIGVTLVEGNGYFYFASVNPRSYADKLKSYQELLLIVDFLKIFNPNLNVSSSFKKTDIIDILVSGRSITLNRSMEKIMNRKGYPATDFVEYITTKLEKLGFIQREDIEGVSFKVLSAFDWINKLYELIKIEE